MLENLNTENAYNKIYIPAKIKPVIVLFFIHVDLLQVRLTLKLTDVKCGVIWLLRVYVGLLSQIV